ncbi:MAG: PepSY-associated TM helix domain-containing protein [Pseudomonadota bacterium]
MKANVVKTFLNVHTWTGLGAGMALFIAFYAGAMTVFFHELEVWDSHAATVAESGSHADAQRLIDRVLQEDPAAAASLRLYPAQPGHPENVARWFERTEGGTFERHDYRLEGDGLNREQDNAHLAGFIYRLHYTAGLPSSFGLYVLGIVCLIYGIALVSGLLVFLPGLFKDLFALRPGKNNKRFWLDTHNIVGVLSLPWHIMFAWSSAVLAIGVFFLAPFQFLVFEDDLQALFGAELGLAAPMEPAGQSAPLVPVAELLRIADAEAPGIEATQLRYSHAGDANATVTIYGDVPVETLDTSAAVTLSATTGAVLNVSHPERASAGATFYNGLIALHFVSFGGFAAKWLYFVLGLAGAYLFYSGNLLWVETRRRRRQPEQPGNTLFLARLNTGVCVGCMAGISAAFLASRALADFADRADYTELAYFGVFLGALGWSFLRSVPNGARDLLYLCAGLTALIPAFDAIFVDMPIWRSLLQARWELFVVDALAIAAAVAFWRMAVAVERRARSGETNSVWAQPQVGSPTTAPSAGASLQNP